MIGGLVLLMFAFAGEAFLNLLSISLPAFRIAGGVLLFVVALQMIFEEEQKDKAADAENPHENDVSVFPLAVPLIAGPGSIASIILMMSEQHGSVGGQAAVIIALCAVLLITYILFRMSTLCARLMGQTVNQVISKILGIVLGAMAAQFVIDGISAVVDGIK
ncbi:membrane protein putative [Acetobacter sp. CAG:977]|nr:membrane protein putative [Acetobacter sp. CAG:977]